MDRQEVTTTTAVWVAVWEVAWAVAWAVEWAVVLVWVEDRAWEEDQEDRVDQADECKMLHSGVLFSIGVTSMVYVRDIKSLSGNACQFYHFPHLLFPAWHNLDGVCEDTTTLCTTFWLP